MQVHMWVCACVDVCTCTDVCACVGVCMCGCVQVWCIAHTCTQLPQMPQRGAVSHGLNTAGAVS